MTFKVSPIRAFKDNYIWMFAASDNKDVCIVDPGDADPVLSVLQSLDLCLSAIILTHHHADHIGGVKKLLEQFPHIPVYGPRSSKIDTVTHPLGDGDRLTLAGVEFSVLAVPGHTLDHIAYYAQLPASGIEESGSGVLFCGDTLFAGGCGRIFEGNPPMMYESLRKLASLPASTMVYCAHEYTRSNLRFALRVEADNPNSVERVRVVEAACSAGIPTVPSLMSMELRTNPFLRCHMVTVRSAVIESMAISSESSDTEVFAALRRWKDSFSG
ncbi:MAG: hydroxyacylglutathione hydrolase [Pseudomonadota bacterium]